MWTAEFEANLANIACSGPTRAIQLKPATKVRKFSVSVDGTLLLNRRKVKDVRNFNTWNSADIRTQQKDGKASACSQACRCHISPGLESVQ